SPVAVDADHPGGRQVENHPAVATGTEGRIDIDAAVTGSEHRDGLAAKHGDVSHSGRSHAATPARGWLRGRKLDASGPIAPQLSRLGWTAPPDAPLQAETAGCGPQQTLSSARDSVGCHGISSVNGSWPPLAGSAPQRLVTAASVKKVLTGKD